MQRAGNIDARQNQNEVGIVMPVRGHLILAARRAQPLDIEQWSASTMLRVTVKLAGLEVNGIGHGRHGRVDLTHGMAKTDQRLPARVERSKGGYQCNADGMHGGADLWSMHAGGAGTDTSTDRWCCGNRI